MDGREAATWGMWLYLLSRSSLAVSSVVIEGSTMSERLSERLSEVMSSRLLRSTSLSSSLTSRRSKLTALL